MIALKFGPPHPPLFALAGELRSFFAADLVEILRVVQTLEKRAVNLLLGFNGLFIAFLGEAGSAAARYGLWLCVRRLARQRSELLSEPSTTAATASACSVEHRLVCLA